MQAMVQEKERENEGTEKPEPGKSADTPKGGSLQDEAEKDLNRAADAERAGENDPQEHRDNN